MLRAIYEDARGIENIVFLNNGKELSTQIRGVDFCGNDFDSLTAAQASELFVLNSWGDLCGCKLTVDIPVRLIAPDGLRHVDIRTEIVLGNPDARGGIDEERIATTLCQPEFSISSRGFSGYFEIELLQLHEQLPEGIRLEMCLTCGLSDYSPAGQGSFGCLACFRDTAEEYRKVNSKSAIFAMWDKMTEYVQETHYCDRWEWRPKGRGYRG